MATGVRQELAQLMNSSGSHKDLAGKYVFVTFMKNVFLFVSVIDYLMIN